MSTAGKSRPAGELDGSTECIDLAGSDTSIAQDPCAGVDGSPPPVDSARPWRTSAQMDSLYQAAAWQQFDAARRIATHRRPPSAVESALYWDGFDHGYQAALGRAVAS